MYKFVIPCNNKNEKKKKKLENFAWLCHAVTVIGLVFLVEWPKLRNLVLKIL